LQLAIEQLSGDAISISFQLSSLALFNMTLAAVYISKTNISSRPFFVTLWMVIQLLLDPESVLFIPFIRPSA
jgi:hypothetical protein